MSGGLLGTEPVRAVELTSLLCACGQKHPFIGVRPDQPQPDVGDYAICPFCFTVYVIAEEWRLQTIAQRALPAWVLELRDNAIREARRK